MVRLAQIVDDLLATGGGAVLSEANRNYLKTRGTVIYLSASIDLLLERTQRDDRASLFGLSYYQRRSPRVDADVLFPIFWHLRYDETYTTVVGPVVHSESPEGHDNWVAPLFAPR